MICDLTQLENLSGGNQEFIDEIIGTFIEHTPQHLQELLDYYQAKNYVQMGELAHKIKPSIDLFGVAILAQPIRDIEQMGKTGAISENLPELIGLIEKTLKNVFEELKAL
jgi:HPt (histidine-containing phosphotransfer) domain-containing protein